MLSEVIITWTVPVGSPITAPCVVPPERERPPIDKRPRYHGTMRFDAGPNNYSEHDVHVSLDQIVRILEIVHEPRGPSE